MRTNPEDCGILTTSENSINPPITRPAILKSSTKKQHLVVSINFFIFGKDSVEFGKQKANSKFFVNQLYLCVHAYATISQLKTWNRFNICYTDLFFLFTNRIVNTNRIRNWMRTLRNVFEFNLQMKAHPIVCYVCDAKEMLLCKVNFVLLLLKLFLFSAVNAQHSLIRQYCSATSRNKL